MEMQKTYIAIDLKSFYASVECVARGLDPLKTNLVVADADRTEKTICLAVSPALKNFGIPGRPRLFEVMQKVADINSVRKCKAPGHRFSGTSTDADALAKDASLEVDYITAPPQMARYMAVSSQIYAIYLQYIAPEDIHVYSIDEVFLDATPYLGIYHTDGAGLAGMLTQEILKQTGITATAGIGTNLYLSKVAMDIVAKHMAPDANGARIAFLDEFSYRSLLWNHTPLSDFWRVGRGYVRKLEKHGLHTMGDIARCSLGQPHEFHNEDLLYSLFGVNAELLIDHAWGYEPCTIAQIKAYKPGSRSVSSGQVLSEPYSFAKTRVVIREMADQLALDLVAKGFLTNRLTVTVGYDRESLTNPEIRKKYHGPVTTDHYGRQIPKHAHGTVNLPQKMSSGKRITEAVIDLFDQVADHNLLFRRLNITANLFSEEAEANSPIPMQLDLFADTAALEREACLLERERRQQTAVLAIKQRFGKNAILRGTNLRDGATARERNRQIGGHRA